MINVLFITSGHAIADLFYDFQNEELTFKVIFPSYSLTGLKKKIQCLQYSSLLSKVNCLKSNKIWRKYYAVNEETLYSGNQNIIIIAPGLMPSKEIDVEMLRRIKHVSNTKIVLMLFDSLNSKSHDKGWNRIFECFPLFDLVMSYDRYDCERYNISHFFLPYKKPELNHGSFGNSDLFFIGNDKGRKKILEDVSRAATDNNVVSDLFMVSRECVLRKKNEIHYLKKRMSYGNVLEKVQATNCILELLCDGQRSASMRYYEAIAYNKKLLTNNADVVNMPFYSPDRIHFFSDADSIDFEWVKDKEEFNYGYSGEFQLENLIYDIVERMMA